MQGLEQQILHAIGMAIEEVNQTLPAEQQISREVLAPMYQAQGPVDSLTLAMLIVAIEQQLESLQIFCPLGDQVPGPGEDNPFRNIQALSEHILRQIQLEKHG